MRQDLYCHACDKNVLFEVPAENGRLIVKCPNCGHEHYRLVENGVITSDRWGSSNQPIFYASNTTAVTTGSACNTTYTYQSWISATSSGGW